MPIRQMRWRALMAAVCGVALALPPAVRAQSLGDLAKKEKERRERVAKKNPKGGQTFSDDDLKGRRRDAAPADEGQPAPGASPSSKADSASGSDAKKDASAEKSYWDSRLQSARDAVKQAEQEVKAAEEAARAASAPASGSGYNDAMAQAQAQRAAQEAVRAARKAQIDAQQALDQMEAEARRAGAL
jgi:hypothetical protein